jgi:hypothetical protein
LINVEPVVESRPTAKHDDELGQATAFSTRPESNSGSDTSDHDMPSHCSINGSFDASPNAWPTATQKLAPAQLTLVRYPFSPDGFALATIDHAAPFQCSINVVADPPIPLTPPTASQSVLAEHATSLTNAPAPGLANGVAFQPVPFHRTAPMPAEAPPTAMQNVVVGHAMPENPPTDPANETIAQLVPFQCSIS